MKKPLKQKLITIGLLAAAVIVTVEFQKFMKRRAAACEDGVCAVPNELIGAKVIGPQTVPLLAEPRNSDELPLPKLIEFEDTAAPDRMMEVILDELAREYSGKLRIQTVNKNRQLDLIEKHRVKTFPTQIFLDARGNELYRHEGFLSKEDILNIWNDSGIRL